MKISVYNNQSDVRISIPSAKKAVKSILTFYNIECDEIAVHFVSEKKISTLHAQFFGDPSTTDCISFPYDENNEDGYRFLGEVFVCPKTAKEYVEQKGGSVYEEISLYVVHGILHLLGYDDMNVTEKRKMRAQEKRILAHLKQSQMIVR